MQPSHCKLVSVVLPTKNRANLLKQSLASVLRQTYQNLEVIVCDNNSSDATADVITSINDVRVRYLPSKRSLPMSSNWGRGAQVASGDFVSFLADDDGFLPTAIEEAVAAATKHSSELVCWNYCFLDHAVEACASSVVFTPFQNGSIALDTAPAIRRVLERSNIGHPLPTMSNAIYSRRIVRSALSRSPNVFNALSGDYAFAMLCFSQLSHYLHLDRPLTVFRRWGSSFSTNYEGVAKQSSKVVEYLREFPEEELACEFPIAFPPSLRSFSANLAVYQNVAKILKEDGFDIRMDVVGLIIAGKCYLNELERDGVDITSDRQRFLDGIARLPLEVRLAIQSREKGSIRRKCINVLRSAIDQSRWFRVLEWKLSANAQRRRHVRVASASCQSSDMAIIVQSAAALVEKGFNGIRQCGTVA